MCWERARRGALLFEERTHHVHSFSATCKSQLRDANACRFDNAVHHWQLTVSSFGVTLFQSGQHFSSIYDLITHYSHSAADGLQTALQPQSSAALCVWNKQTSPSRRDGDGQPNSDDYQYQPQGRRSVPTFLRDGNDDSTDTTRFISPEAPEVWLNLFVLRCISLMCQHLHACIRP